MKRKSILLVDDEKFILASLSRELTKENFEVTTAANGEKALDKIYTKSFDLVITDLRMPGINGLQVLATTKQKNPQTLVIVLTGYADLESSIEALRFGADDFLQKPCDTEELLFRIENCFTKQRLQKKVAMYENFLPVCSYCRKIRDDRPGQEGTNNWYNLEEYFSKDKGFSVSHGCCPDCFSKQMKKL